MEPASPIQALGVNPFPSRFIYRTIPWGGFGADTTSFPGLFSAEERKGGRKALGTRSALIEERANDNTEMTAGSKRIHAIQAHYKRKWFYL